MIGPYKHVRIRRLEAIFLDVLQAGCSEEEEAIMALQTCFEEENAMMVLTNMFRNKKKL